MLDAVFFARRAMMSLAPALMRKIHFESTIFDLLVAAKYLICFVIVRVWFPWYIDK